jgi:hypothetical protein
MPTIAVLVVHWPRDRPDCELIEMLFVDKAEAFRKIGKGAMIILTGDRDSFLSSEAYRSYHDTFEETIYLGLARPAPEFLESLLLLLARTRQNMEYRKHDCETDTVSGVAIDAFEYAAAKVVDGLFAHVDAAGIGGSAIGLSNALGVFPRILASTSLAWVGVALERSAAEMRNFMDLEQQIWCLEDPVTSGVIRTRATLNAMRYSTVFELGRHYQRLCEGGATEIREIANARVNYLRIGEAAAKNADARNLDVNLLTLFAWWAAYFRGRALFFEGRGDFASAIGALIREIEVVMLGELLEAGVVEVTDNGECILNERDMTGISPLLAAMKEEIIRSAGEEVWLALGATVGCRNRSSVGHGFSGLNRKVFSDGLDCVSKVWSGLARNGTQCSGVLRQLLARLHARIKFVPSEVLARQALVHAASVNVDRAA